MSEAVEYSTPWNEEKGIGNVILKADAEALIPGVKVIPYALWPDDRGYFLEVARMGQGGVADRSPAFKHSGTAARPGGVGWPRR